ncbi:MAG TPA: TIGR03067 domain-containing protein [Urbifossiella sp.]|jgi:uncharacterized protein (TIGR03067 family)|nr:TIGR03067 domain-containing protein [Urbifossiella sp.]
MMRLMAAVVAGLTVVGAGTGQPDGPAKSLDGEYKVQSASFGGKQDTEKLVKVTVVLKDGTISIRDGEKVESAGYKLDPSKTPAWIDLVPKRPDGKMETVKGIYQTKTTPAGLELTLALTKNEGDRPTDFKGAGDDSVVMKLLRKDEK